jgi:tRNA nucleotidyltransferase (CCA-adding enzyme)
MPLRRFITMAVFRAARELITLSEAESQLFRALQDTIVAKGLSTQLRVSGGWVRDKLLRRESDDIDIALDDMMGEPFAKLVVEHLGVSKHVGTILANPAASKHLETACLHLFGFHIDLVNLRSEEYSDTSRIPQITFGTPQQDAFRRDLTINSIFYNISQDTIEDWTGLGFLDLERRIARTPLHPLQTFLDDPLRVLRIIRFATRFDLSILPEIAEAAQDPQVQNSLLEKVSRERIAKEYTLTMKGYNPVRALELIQAYRLTQIIFKPSKTSLASSIEEHFPIVFKLPPLQGETAFILYTSAVLSYFQDTRVFSAMIKKTKVPEYEWICFESLKVLPP